MTFGQKTPFDGIKVLAQSFFMKTSFAKSSVLTTAFGLILLGCSSPQGGSYSDYSRETVTVSGPPPIQRQVVVTAPPPNTVVGPSTTTMIKVPETRPGYVWIDGDWAWKSHGWEWEEGHWARQPYRDARWVAGHYSYRDGQHIYVPGYWTR